MKFFINISNKKDWINKCKDKIDNSRFNITYSNLLDKKQYRKFDAVIPLYEKDIHHLKKFPSKNGSVFLIPSTEVMDICEDKKKFYDFMVSNRFDKYIPQISDSLSPPYILKKKLDEFGKNSFIIKDNFEEQKYQNQLEDKEYFKQEYISGKDEFTTHFIFDNGEFKYIHTLKFTFKVNHYVKGAQLPPFKNAVITKSQNEFIEVFKEILTALNYRGVGCFDYKLFDGIPKIFEINPRVGGSLPLDVNRFLDSYIHALKPSRLIRFKRFFRK
jgi:carbamoylphosphate synthase large subunit